MAVNDQHKIGSGFGYRSTAAEVIDGVDLTGKLAIVTGVYSYAVDPDEAARLWTLSAALTGVNALTA